MLLNAHDFTFYLLIAQLSQSFRALFQYLTDILSLDLAMTHSREIGSFNCNIDLKFKTYIQDLSDIETSDKSSHCKISQIFRSHEICI